MQDDDPQDNDTSPTTKPGVTISRQAHIGSAATIVLDDTTLSQLHARVLEQNPRLGDAVLDAIREHATGLTPVEFLESFEDDVDNPVIDPADASVTGLAMKIARGDIRGAITLLEDVLPTLGQGRSADADTHVLPRLLGLANSPTVVSVTVRESFWRLRREQREAVLAYIAAYAEHCGVRLHASGLQLRKLHAEHRDALPVSQDDITTTPSTPTGDAAEEATQTLEADGRPVSILRALQEEPSETLPYTAVYSQHSEVSRSRVRQCLTTLQELGLVATYGPTQRRRVELQSAGREYLNLLNARIGRQQRLPEAVSGGGQFSPQAVLSAPDRSPPTQPGPYRTSYLNRYRHHSAAATAPESGISLVSHPSKDGLDARTHGVSYDAAEDEAVVAIRASGPLQYVVSSAVALASPEFLHQALPAGRLDELDEPGMILRDARGIGCLSEEALEDGQVLLEALIEWGEQLGEMTHRLHHGDYEDRDQLRSEIMRVGQGLSGSIVHLLDALGTRVVRELRVPEGVDAEKLDSLADSIAFSAAIQSGYGVHNGYKHLFEHRDEKRQQAPGVEVDAAAPYGGLIGGLIVTGDDVHRLRPLLEDALKSPRELHEDAPEFAIQLTIEEPDQESYRETIRRVLATKRLRPRREVTELLAMLAGSPQAAAHAIHYGLETEDEWRTVRVDETRAALTTLSTDVLLPDAVPTVRRVVKALLEEPEPVPTDVLADRAGVSARSIRRHSDTLEALEIIDTTSNGIQLVVTPHSTEGRARQDVLPKWVDSSSRLVDAAEQVAHDLLDPDAYCRATLPLGAFPADPPSFEAFLDELPQVEWWLQGLAMLRDQALDPDRRSSATVSMGPSIQQAGLSSTSPTGVSAP